jgi:ribonuclease P protein subunit POP4
MFETKDTRKREIIGSQIEIIDANNKGLIGIKGEIINETKNMFVLSNGKKLIKTQVKIKINGIIIDGKKLNLRPEDRIKK